MPFDLAEPPPAGTREAQVYVRPHQIELQREAAGPNALLAIVKEVNTAGPQVKVELLSEWGQKIHVELSHERQHVLELKTGDGVALSTKAMKVFTGQ